MSQQDLESLVSKFNGRIAFYGVASLRKYDVTGPVPDRKSLVRRTFRGQEGDTRLGGKKKKFIAKKIELVTTYDFISEEILIRNRVLKFGKQKGIYRKEAQKQKKKIIQLISKLFCR